MIPIDSLKTGALFVYNSYKYMKVTMCHPNMANNSLIGDRALGVLLDSVILDGGENVEKGTIEAFDLKTDVLPFFMTEVYTVSSIS